MADIGASIQILISNLKQLTDHHHLVISGVKEGLVKQLTDNLGYFNASEVVGDREVRLKIRDAVYEAEDAVEAYVTQAVAAKSKNWIGRFFSGKVELDGIARKLQEVRVELGDLFGDMMEIESGSPEIIRDDEERPQLHQTKKTGNFEDESRLIKYLTPQTQSQSIDVVSIIDRHDLGKTTLAKKVLHDRLIQYEFPTRIWVDVSEPPRDVYLSILKEFTVISEEIRGMSEPELARKVSGYLGKGRFLLVANDVLSPKEWDKLCVALPTYNRTGKILVTSRDIRVGLYGHRMSNPHELRFLNLNESWELLRSEVFGGSKCPPEVESYGRVIARKCRGLPLAIMVIGGVLKSSTGDAWREVYERLSEYDTSDGLERTMHRVISLSYDALPYHLKACFLYFGIFPRDFDVPAWKLIRMWIAEGFVREKMNHSVEETAESYLNSLIVRNLLRVDKRNCEGKVKTCRIHDAILDFCKLKAGKDGENFLQEIAKLPPPIQNDITLRRLCIHSDIMSFAASRPSGLRVRSLVCFSKEETSLPSEYISTIPLSFKLLRVLEAKPIKFPKLSSDMFDLIHLRYIHFSFNLSILPPLFSKFQNLQTLIVETTHRSLLIKADIYKMTHLRDLKTNAIAVLPEPTNDVEGGGNIRALSIISTQNCTEKVIDKLRSVRSLGICGRLIGLLKDKTEADSEGSFENLVKLDAVEILKLKNDVFPSPPSEGKLPHLPSKDKFPPNLRILTLSETYLEWSQMAVLGLLEKLQVLKLKEKAFMGNYWETIGGGFRRLEVLLIGRTDLVVWKASSRHFPILQKLDLRHCDELREIPEGLADIPSLGVLDLNHCRASATSANKIKNIKEAKSRDNSSVEFKLSIFPP